MDTVYPNHADLPTDISEEQQAELVRELLARIADKWTMLVIEALEHGEPVRFSRLQDVVGGISQKMLTKTLRQLERDGLVIRRVHPVIPPHVDYQLTALGLSLGEAICGVWVWVAANFKAVERARRAFATHESTSTAATL
jgi:DNA-binding HxlR family transcriptional regulator